MSGAALLAGLAVAASLAGADPDAPPAAGPAAAPVRARGPAVTPLPPPERERPLAPAPGGVAPQRPVPAGAPVGPIALVGATLHPVSGPDVPGGTLVIDQGRIAAIGRDVAVPPGARRVDLEGKHVWPGLFHASTVLGLTEIGAVRATLDIGEVGDVNPNARAETAVDPDSELIPVARSNGVLLALTAGRGGLVSGSAAILALDGWTRAEMTFRAPAALCLEWPDMRLDRRPEAPTPLDKQQRALDERLRRLREAFDAARGWVEGRAAARLGAPAADHDVKWEAMEKALRREIPVVVRAGSILEMRAALDFAREQELRLVIEGGRDAVALAPELARRKVPVVVTDVMAVGRPWEPYDAGFTAPARLHEAGVEYCIAPGADSWNARNLPYVAAKAAAGGLGVEEALRAITIHPARIFGVADRVGSLEPGKDATLFVSDGHPLDTRSNVERAFLAGRELDLADRHKRLYERWRLKPRRAGDPRR